MIKIYRKPKRKPVVIIWSLLVCYGVVHWLVGIGFISFIVCAVNGITDFASVTLSIYACMAGVFVLGLVASWLPALSKMFVSWLPSIQKTIAPRQVSIKLPLWRVCILLFCVFTLFGLFWV